ncbi:MAG: PorT family protein [Tannerella sp.]|jgi:hypothetical protein|nr:PorT family protein [Tannerella sp.]
MKEEKGKWEKIIHSKLYDFEVNVSPDDWNIISGKLPGNRSVGLHLRYSYIAAAITVLLILGGLYFYSYDDPAPDAVAVVDSYGTDVIAEKPVDNGIEKERLAAGLSRMTTGQSADAAGKNVTASPGHPQKMRLARFDTVIQEDHPVRLELPGIGEMDSIVRNMINIEQAKSDNPNEDYMREFENIKGVTTFHEKPLIADASSDVKHSRWGFGMGGGSYAVNSTSGNVISGNTLLRSSDEYIRDKDVMKINEDGFMKSRSGLEDAGISGTSDGLKTRPYEIPTGKIKHKTPISVGLGVSYYLNNRWSLQSGVTSTILRSEWSSGNITGDLEESRQNLYYIGIPLSVSYKIAEWKRFQLYASTGGMCEFNVAGIFKETITSGNLIKTRSEHLRMKEPVWSVNARSGINYPLWRFINVYAEAGASYYFDNKSEIKTIRSDKPFNISLQAGIRFGF